MGDSFRLGNSYRPGSSSRRDPPRRPSNRNQRSSPDPNRDYNYSPRNAPGASEFRFGARNERDPRTEFSFRHGDSHSGRFSPRDRPPQRRNDDDRYRPRGDGRRYRDNDRDRRYGGRGGRRPVLSANERPLIATRRGSTPDRLEGMEKSGVQFRSDDEPSDNEVIEDLTSDEEDQSHDPQQSGAGVTDDSGDEVLQPPRKRVKLSPAPEEQPDRPKWSNPDPYTILPPDEERTKRGKDVVKMIRNAKIQVENVDVEEEKKINAVTANNDFISFDFGDEATVKDDAETDDGEISESRYSRTDNGRREESDVNSPYRPPLHIGSAVRAVEGSYQPPLSVGDGIPDLPYSAASTIPPPPSESPPASEATPPPPPYSAPPYSAPPSAPLSPSLRSTSKVLGKRGKGPGLDGSIQDDWIVQPGRTETPWCTVDHSMTVNTADWLNMEIADFYEYIKPRKYEHEVRADLFRRISSSLQRVHPDGKAYCFGSYASGMYLPNSDMDLAFVSDAYMRSGVGRFAPRPSWMHRLAGRLVSDGIAEDGTTQVIFHAKVPLIKFVDRRSSIKVDISFEQYNGVVAIKTFERWKVKYPVLPVLVSVIKQFLLMRGLSEVYLGGIGGFTVICLVVSLLQHHPGVSSGKMDPSLHLGEMLMNFFDLYGKKFDTLRVGIRMDPPEYFAKSSWTPVRKQDPSRLTILDPNNDDNDISGGSSKIALIQETFADAYDQLQHQLHFLYTLPVEERGRQRSILRCILGGDYSQVEYQRDRAADVLSDDDSWRSRNGGGRGFGGDDNTRMYAPAGTAKRELRSGPSHGKKDRWRKSGRS